MAAPIIPDPDDPSHYVWEPDPVRPALARRLLSGLGKLLLAALLSTIVSVALLRFIDPPMWTWRLERALFPPAKVAEVKHDWVPLEQISASCNWR